MNYPDIDSVKPEGVFEEIDSHGVSFLDLRDVYLGSADVVDIATGTRAEILESYTSSSTIYATCGGFFSLNLLNVLIDKKVSCITFFDINKHSVAFARSVVNLIKNSKDVKSFLENYLMLNVGKEEEKYILLPTFEKDRKALFTKNKRYHNEISSLIFYAISKSPYDKEQLFIKGFMHIGGTGVGKVTLYPREDNIYLDENTLGVGYGWLASDETFLAMKSWLKSTNIKFLATNITQLPSESEDIVFASNINSWTPIKCAGTVFP